MAEKLRFTRVIWLVGCGNMSGAMLSRWLTVGLDPATVTVIRPSGVSPAPGVRILTELPDEPAPDLLLLGVKPQKLSEVAPGVARAVGPETKLVSILAGATMATLRASFPRAGAIVRAMPNTPVALGRGVVGLHGDMAPEVEALMSPLGLVEWIADEVLFDVVTALAGSGPAFLFRFIDALARAGAALGLPADQAARLAIAMTDGAAGLAAAASEPPTVLADRVASPGGMTRKGLNVLDEGGALDRLLQATLDAAVRRGREMAAEAGQGPATRP